MDAITVFDPRVNTRAELVDFLRDRDGNDCYLCDKPFTDERRPTIDHVTPLSKGGGWETTNLKLADRKCNQDKADREFVDGVLESKPRRIGYRERKLSKVAILEAFCEECMDGRQLWPGDTCPFCDGGAVAFPWTTRLEPKDCPHSGPWWCFMDSIGVIPREPAFVDAFGAGDEFTA